MPIVDACIDELRARVDLVALIGKDVQLRAAGKIHKGLCPFHAEKTASFSVDPEKRLWHCFGCGKSGDAFAWMQERFGMTFPEAAAELAKITNYELRVTEDRATSEEKAERAQARKLEETRKAWLWRVNELAAEYYASQLRITNCELRDGEAVPENLAAYSYMRDRGFSDETLQSWGVGYAPSTGGLLCYLKEKARGKASGAVVTRCAVAAGLVGQAEGGYAYERFRGRVIFPIRDERGRTVGLGGRILPDTATRGRGDAEKADCGNQDAKMPGGAVANGSGHRPAKYINSTESLVFKKGAVLYGLDRARDEIRRNGRAVLVEGYTDVMAYHQNGFCNIVAPLGTAFTDNHAALLSRFCKVMVARFDNDDAGRKAARAAVAVCLRAGLELQIAGIVDEENYAHLIGQWQN